MDADLKAYWSEKRRWIDSTLDVHLPDEAERPAVLHTAMRYCVFSGGKRFRPIVGLAAQAAFGLAAEEDALLPLCALELLHTYTLVHDDLPAMDDDDMRRGRPSAHIRFGEANAILAGDALLTLAFEWMANCRAPEPWLPGQYALELAEAAGHRGVIAGQVEDLEAEGSDPDEDRLGYIHLHKTAALIRAAVRIGGIAGHASTEALEALSVYGCKLGLAFQIADDVLDETADSEKTGKPSGSDRKNNKQTYVALLGVEGAKQKAAQLAQEAQDTLQDLSGAKNKQILEKIAAYVVHRDH